MAKQILVDERNIMLPPVDVVLTATDVYGRERLVKAQLAPARHARYSDVVLEVTRDNRRPDAIGISDGMGGEHRIEVFVNHAVDESKAAELEKLDCACYEICLNDLSQQITVDVLRVAVTATPTRVRWIAFPGMAIAKQRLSANLRKMLLAAEAEKRTEEDRAKQAYAAQVRASKVEQTFWSRRTKTLSREAARAAKANSVYSVATVDEKRDYLRIKLRLPNGAPPHIVNQEVRGETAFGVDRDIWQADVYRKSVFGQAGAQIGLDDLLIWLELRYNVSEPFPGASSAAIWDYFKALEASHIVRHEGNQRFRVVLDVAPWLESQVAVTGSWFWRPEAGSCTLSDLQEANDTGAYNLSSESLLAILHRVRATHQSGGEPDDAARSLAQRLTVSSNAILELLAAARVVTQPKPLPERRPLWRNEPFEWPQPT